jgi:hypothetical protein
VLVRAAEVVRVDEVVDRLLGVQSGDQVLGGLVAEVEAVIARRGDVVHDRRHHVVELAREVGDERLMALGEDRHRRAEDLADAAGPAAGGVDHEVAFERAFGSFDAARLVADQPRRRAHVEVLGEQRAVQVAVDVAVGAAEQAAHEVVAAHVGDEFLHAVAVEQHGVLHAERVLDPHAALVGRHIGLRVGGAQIAVAGDAQAVVALELCEDLHRQHADLDRERLHVLGLDDPDREPGGGAGDAAAVDQRHVAHAEPGELAGRAQAERAGADDDDPHRAASKRSATSSIVASSIVVEMQVSPLWPISTPAR